MDLVTQTASWLALMGGGAFLILGAIGVLRMPDLYTRMHAASLVDTMGAGLITLGLMIQAGPTLVAVKLGIIFVFLCLTGPISTHALAGAAMMRGEPPRLTHDRARGKFPGPLGQTSPLPPDLLGHDS
ncbi:monovalent cation/H(+) antiporter subunit G [Pararhodospirillum oryzae]|uniref:Sodium:proton antiporter n=1 Tax=Pararhodospirillum oryzae TaxID=478448 RepID=A0A512HBI3_9PROT|nr:monovalent cation/H(+) antiporter subunit G [Pararhodospirillum oryzae]GEO82811.1 sodium:proton antiporter [Pararhodospirillum oryzae]